VCKEMDLIDGYKQSESRLSSGGEGKTRSSTRFINFIILGSLSQRPHLFSVIFSRSAIIGYVAPRLLVCCRLPV
jgi:hypothetical protein